MRTIPRWLAAVLFLTLASAAGWLAHIFLNLNFFVGFGLAAVAMLVVGLTTG
jgi:hypothetical protein